jgi:hypothetical protein
MFAKLKFPVAQLKILLTKERLAEHLANSLLREKAYLAQVELPQWQVNCTSDQPV